MAKKTTKKVAAKKETATQPLPIIGEAIKMYQHDTTINENIVNNCLTEEQRKCVETLDGAMSPLDGLELNRLLTMSVIREYMKQVNVGSVQELAGKTIESIPYMSTTKNELHGMVKRRYDIGLDKPVCIVVSTEGKVKGIDVNALADGNDFAHQNEVILARGQKFIVKKIVMERGYGEAYPIIHLAAV